MLILMEAGESVYGRLIGRGSFSRVMEAGDGCVYIETRDPIKEIYTRVRGSHIPRLDWVGRSLNGGDVYRAPRYAKLSKRASPQAWADFMELRRAYKPLYTEYTDNFFVWTPAEFTMRMRDAVCRLDITSELKEDFEALTSAALDFGDTVCVEVFQRNMAVEGDKLILLDAFFDMVELRRARGW